MGCPCLASHARIEPPAPAPDLASIASTNSWAARGPGTSNSPCMKSLIELFRAGVSRRGRSTQCPDCSYRNRSIASRTARASVQSALWSTSPVPLTNPRHVWQGAVCLMKNSIQRIHYHPALQAFVAHELSGATYLLFDGAVMGPGISRVSFTGVGKDEVQTFAAVLLGKIVQGWRRQPAVRSGGCQTRSSMGSRPKETKAVLPPRWQRQSPHHLARSSQPVDGHQIRQSPTLANPTESLRSCTGLDPLWNLIGRVAYAKMGLGVAMGDQAARRRGRQITRRTGRRRRIGLAARLPGVVLVGGDPDQIAGSVALAEQSFEPKPKLILRPVCAQFLWPFSGRCSANSLWLISARYYQAPC
jgi:hypothetical protein